MRERLHVKVEDLYSVLNKICCGEVSCQELAFGRNSFVGCCRSILGGTLSLKRG
jgi:hypothetical protein